MKLSARNMLNGKVEGVTVGKVMASVKIRIEAPDMITAIITQESINELDIKEGDVVKAIIKSTEVMIGKE
ncbi:MAG TPA: TOBE domain-containing protein [Methanothermobacter sp.]|nr:TOBE domain-containing protein [Methanothermobacter sp.]